METLNDISSELRSLTLNPGLLSLLDEGSGLALVWP